MTTVFEERVQEARIQLGQMGNVPDGGEGHRKADEMEFARETAVRYLNGVGWSVLEVLGIEIVAACLVALGRSEFDTTEKGELCLIGLSRDEDASFDIRQDEFVTWIKTGTIVSDMVRRAYESSDDAHVLFMVEAAAVAAVLMGKGRTTVRKATVTD